MTDSATPTDEAAPLAAATSTGHATISVAAILAETAARRPDKVALIVGDQKISYSTLWQ